MWVLAAFGFGLGLETVWSWVRDKLRARRPVDLALATALYRVESAFAGTGLTAAQAVRIAHLAAQTAKD